LAEILRLELAPHGISVTVACPPDTDTPQLEAENRSKPALTRRITATGGIWPADKIAAAIVLGAQKGRFMVAPGLAMAGLARFHGFVSPFFRLRQARLLRQEMEQGGTD
jgi:3-dehydrosphinganine reductase